MILRSRRHEAEVDQTKGRRGAPLKAAQDISPLCWHPECVQGHGVPVFASRQSDEQNSFPGSAGHVQRGFAHDFVAMILLLRSLRQNVTSTPEFNLR